MLNCWTCCIPESPKGDLLDPCWVHRLSLLLEKHLNMEATFTGGTIIQPKVPFRGFRGQPERALSGEWWCLLRVRYIRLSSRAETGGVPGAVEGSS